MQLQQLRYFIEVAKNKNISEAARSLHISQPTLSQQIINLEKELGIQLLIRHSKTATLSDAGQQFLVHAQRIVGATDQLAELMHKHSFLIEGTLRIGMLWIAGYLDLFETVAGYRTLHPGLTYTFRIDGSGALLDSLLKRDLHCAFIIGTEELFRAHSDIFAHKIIRDRYVVVVSRENPLSRKESIGVGDLAEQPLIMPDPNTPLNRQLRALFREKGISPTAIAETSQSDIILQLAAHNLGVGFSSENIARRCQTGQYAIIPLEEPSHRDIYYVTLTELLDYPSISSFTHWIEQQYAPRPITSC